MTDTPIEPQTRRERARRERQGLGGTRRRGRAAPGRLAAQALVLALVVGATTAFAGLHKSVTVDVDGEVRTLDVVARTVEDALRAAGVEVAAGDEVTPALETTVPDDGTVVVRRSRELLVEVDGSVRLVQTTAGTVAEVLAELGLRDGARASASRGSALGRDTLRFSTEKTVHVTFDGATVDLTTTAPTVREALQELGIVLGELDLVSVSLDASTVDGLVVMVTRVGTDIRSDTSAMPFETVEEEDPRLPVGSTVVDIEGVAGTHVVSYVAHVVGGQEVGRTILAERVVRAPVDEVVRVGTMPVPDPAEVAVRPVDPGTARGIALQMVIARGWGEDQFACLDRLWTKESNWRVTAENPSSGAYGIPQSLPGSKMATAGADWRTNASTQITWGLGYIDNRYGTPWAAWAHSQARNWY